ncbi:MAG: NYN domain-containing protein [Methylobacter sp.]|nr:NYN domain-containing protein [Methylobacter sp.]
MYQIQEPMPSLSRMMVFIDGENIVARYQSMLNAGRRAVDGVQHQKDVFAWVYHAVWPGLNVVQRATLYTYVVGDEKAANDAATAIQALTFGQYALPGQHFTGRLINTLYPRVFKKQRNRSGKGVDIQMTVDILCNVYQNNLDTVYLISGDGDYEPIIHECQRMGKQVVVAALSDGLSPKLKLIADRFIDLDNSFFGEQ